MATQKTKAPSRKVLGEETKQAIANKKGKAASKNAITAPAVKTPAGKAEAKALPRPTVTTIIATADVGWGNQLFLRGEGGGLSWDIGVPMTCNGHNEWVWVTTSNDRVFNFKFILNDKFWSQGDNHVVTCGNTHNSYPTF